MERDKNGRFVKGHVGGPGRPTKKREIRYTEILQTTCTFRDWQAIVQKAIDQSKRGDSVARKWLTDYLVGTAPQKHEVTGAEGGPLFIVNWDDNGKD